MIIVAIPECVSCVVRCPVCRKRYHVNSGSESMRCFKCGTEFILCVSPSR